MAKSDEEYYSEDFEQEDEETEIVEVIEEINLSQDPNTSAGHTINTSVGQVSQCQRPSSPPSLVHEVASEEMFVIYTSNVGPRLTMKPKVGKTKVVTSPRSVRRKGSNAPKAANKTTREESRKHFSDKRLNVDRGVKSENPSPRRFGRKEESRDMDRKSSASPDESPRAQDQVIVSVSKSSSGLCLRNRIKNRPTAALVRSRKAPSNLSITSRNYSMRDRRPFASPLGLGLGYHPPMRLGASKPLGTVAQRVASARRITMNDLKSRHNSCLKELEEFKKDNKGLKITQHRLICALKKWEGRDADLPRLLTQHKDELKIIQTQLKKSLLANRDLEEKLKTKDSKFVRVEQELQKLRQLATKENLRDRSELQEQCEMMAGNLLGCEKRIRQYMRHIEIIESNHKHQISAERKKFIKVNNFTMELRQEIGNLKVALRDKDRMLNYIQMRSTGRNLMRGFQEQEKQHNARLNPAVVTLGSRASDESRSNSPPPLRNVSVRSHRTSDSLPVGVVAPGSGRSIQERALQERAEATRFLQERLFEVKAGRLEEVIIATSPTLTEQLDQSSPATIIAIPSNAPSPRRTNPFVQLPPAEPQPPLPPQQNFADGHPTFSEDMSGGDASSLSLKRRQDDMKMQQSSEVVQSFSHYTPTQSNEQFVNLSSQSNVSESIYDLSEAASFVHQSTHSEVSQKTQVSNQEVHTASVSSVPPGPKKVAEAYSPRRESKVYQHQSLPHYGGGDYHQSELYKSSHPYASAHPPVNPVVPTFVHHQPQSFRPVHQETPSMQPRTEAFAPTHPTNDYYKMNLLLSGQQRQPRTKSQVNSPRISEKARSTAHLPTSGGNFVRQGQHQSAPTMVASNRSEDKYIKPMPQSRVPEQMRLPKPSPKGPRSHAEAKREMKLVNQPSTTDYLEFQRKAYQRREQQESHWHTLERGVGKPLLHSPSRLPNLQKPQSPTKEQYLYDPSYFTKLSTWK